METICGADETVANRRHSDKRQACPADAPAISSSQQCQSNHRRRQAAFPVAMASATASPPRLRCCVSHIAFCVWLICPATRSTALAGMKQSFGAESDRSCLLSMHWIVANHKREGRHFRIGRSHVARYLWDRVVADHQGRHRMGIDLHRYFPVTS